MPISMQLQGKQKLLVFQEDSNLKEYFILMNKQKRCIKKQ